MKDCIDEEQRRWKDFPLGFQKVNWDMALDTMNRRSGCTLAATSMTRLAILEPVAADVLVELYATKFSRDWGYGVLLWKVMRSKQ
jgi:hypothetical protein